MSHLQIQLITIFDAVVQKMLFIIPLLTSSLLAQSSNLQLQQDSRVYPSEVYPEI